MALNDQLDEQAADLRNIQAESAPLPQTPEVVVENKKGSLSRNQIITVTVIAIAVMAVIYYLVFQRLSSSAPAYQGVCPKGQPQTASCH